MSNVKSPRCVALVGLATKIDVSREIMLHVCLSPDSKMQAYIYSDNLFSFLISSCESSIMLWSHWFLFVWMYWQPGDNPPSAKPWGFSPAVEVVQQPQVVFLQPVISQRTASEPKGPPSKRRKHKKYLPILKSYPKIAPHPGDSPRSSCTSSSSSTVTASVKSSSSSSSCWDAPDGDKQQAVQTSSSSVTFTPNHITPTRHHPASPQPHTPLTDSNTASCPGVEKPTAGRLEPTTEPTEMHAKTLQTQPQADIKDGICQNSDSDSNDKRKRFCNTYNILSKSGLLDITLRTKELIRQNRRTQVELDQLREHTNLFMEALQTGDLCIWSKLQMSMLEESEKEKTVNTGSETQMDHLK